MDLWTRPAARRWRGGQRVDRRAFHARLPGYRPTPLRSVTRLAELLAVASVLVKDESARFDLSAFKMLGASWAAYRAVCARLGATLSWDALLGTPAVRDLRLLAATAGNHGHAVARVGRWLQIPTSVLVPADTGQAVVDAIAADGAEIRRVDGSYDETVRAAAALALRHDDQVLVQDTAWPGYEQVPAWIVEGYQTMFHELDDQLATYGTQADLIVVPVGVGSLMSAAIGYYRAASGSPSPALLGVEPVSAACALASLRAGRRVSVPAGRTEMAGLNATTVSSTAWPLLRDGLDAAIAISDTEARHARMTLASAGVHVGLCGAATLAAVSSAGRTTLDLTAASTVVLIATDAATPVSRQTEGEQT